MQARTLINLLRSPRQETVFFPSLETSSNSRQNTPMRVLRTMITSLLGMGIVAVIAFFLTREILLQVAISQLKSSAGRLQKIARNTGGYIQTCREKGIVESTDGAIGSIHLRFTSDTEYVIEVICSQFRLDPIEVERSTLAPLVTKVAGSSGLVWQDEPTLVVLELWGRSRQLGIEDRRIVTEVSQPPFKPIVPITSCEGYGYTCCQPEGYQGEGELLPEAQDCPRTCYTSCIARPIVTAFSTRPFYDQKTRILQVQSGQSVDFSYVIGVDDPETMTVTVDFGDGQQEQFTGATGQTSHTYQCRSGACQYQASVVGTTAAGVSSVVTPLAKIQITVQ